MYNPKTSSLQFVLPFILACLCSTVLANKTQISYREEDRAVLDRILANYDARIRPPAVNGTDGRVYVHVSVFVRSIPNIDDDKQEYSVQLILRERWVDERLKFNFMKGYITLSQNEHIWMPSLSFSNEKRSHFNNMLIPNEYVRIYFNGEIFYSTRISLTLGCSMNFRLYPFDCQYCSLPMTSYGYSTKDVEFLWTRVSDPIQVDKDEELRGFILADFSSTIWSDSRLSCLKVNFSFKRNLMPALICIYIPCIVLVFASFVSLWLDQEAVTARVLLGVVILLAMVFQVSSVGASLPPVSYIKAVDIWTSVCLIFIIATLLEFVTLNYCSRYDIKTKCEQVNGSEESNTRSSHYKYSFTWLSKYSRSQKIDIVSRIAFPALFTLFNLVYWITYLSIS